jgi:hypothetical protein
MTKTTHYGLARRAVLVGIALAAVLSTIPMCNAQGVAPAWLAAADPFQKFVHDILDFTKWCVAQTQTAHDKEVRDAAPSLVKSMHEVAAMKRQLASDIDAALSDPKANDFVDLDRQTNQLDKAVRQLVINVQNLAPDWVVQHNDLVKDIDQMELDKTSASRQGLNLAGEQLDSDGSRKFAERLKSLADQLDGLADQIAAAINQPAHA